MQSINLSKVIVSEFDTIRVSINIIPDEQKHAHTIDVCEMNSKQLTFKIQMNDITERVVVVYRKKNIFGSDNIIASTVIKTKDISILKKFINNEHKK